MFIDFYELKYLWICHFSVFLPFFPFSAFFFHTLCLFFLLKNFWSFSEYLTFTLTAFCWQNGNPYLSFRAFALFVFPSCLSSTAFLAMTVHLVLDQVASAFLFCIPHAAARVQENIAALRESLSVGDNILGHSPDLGFHLSKAGWMSVERKSSVTREGEKNVVCNLSKLKLDFSGIWRTLPLLSGLEFPSCSYEWAWKRHYNDHLFLYEIGFFDY